MRRFNVIYKYSLTKELFNCEAVWHMGFYCFEYRLICHAIITIEIPRTIKIIP